MKAPAWWRRRSAALALAGAACVACVPARAGFWLDGERRITLHARDGSQLEIGRVHFHRGADGRSSFRLALDAARFTDHFLSMREFKCLPGQGEILCHVPYPHRSPAVAAPGDLAWLEHSLLFMFKRPNEFGAQLWNGIYFKLAHTDEGLDGVPQAVDLNLISAPPARADVAPFRPALRDDLPPNARWFTRLTIR
ncbi:MAG: hypothetical protein JNL30_04180 [Rubrivivax sp.]|nr:hypothetical protein [Rubrivivax sp.]